MTYIGQKFQGIDLMLAQVTAHHSGSTVYKSRNWVSAYRGAAQAKRHTTKTLIRFIEPA